MQTSALCFCLFLLISLSSVQATCWGDRPSSASESLGACCWMSDNSCCAVNGTATDLGDLQSSMDRLVRLGMSSKCYKELTNLECSVCSPNQQEYITYGGPRNGDDDDEFFDNKRWIFRICPSLCENIFEHCANEIDAELLGADYSSTSTHFCESISGKELVSDEENISSIFGGASWLVSEFSCYAGASNTVIQENVGVCITSHSDILDVVPASSPSSLASKTVVLSFTLLFMALAILF